ncbi:hypothetical protein OKW33_006204 [Paraburkholderia atlantica]|uniref:DUF2254 family protein n=1 Tax=Paraburkholderia atlantica TaxID=2654982 RepID=UPI003D1C047F
MAWNRRYSLNSYVRSALWVVPILALLAALALNRASEFVVQWVAMRGGYDLRHGFLDVSMEEAHAILDRVFTLNLSCLVFTFGSLLVAIQVAGGQYTPRICDHPASRQRDSLDRRAIRLFIALDASNDDRNRADTPRAAIAGIGYHDRRARLTDGLHRANRLFRAFACAPSLLSGASRNMVLPS